jgi:hypothetical protein
MLEIKDKELQLVNLTEELLLILEFAAKECCTLVGEQKQRSRFTRGQSA